MKQGLTKLKQFKERQLIERGMKATLEGTGPYDAGVQERVETLWEVALVHLLPEDHLGLASLLCPQSESPFVSTFSPLCASSFGWIVFSLQL